MSRTRKSRPHFVRIREAKPLEVEAWHTLACRNGKQECDLPDRAKTPHHSNRTRCTWFYRGEERTCGCSMCTMKRERREMRRRVRHGKRRAIGEQLDLAAAPDHCECPCHHGPDACAICTNDYADLCESGD